MFPPREAPPLARTPYVPGSAPRERGRQHQSHQQHQHRIPYQLVGRGRGGMSQKPDSGHASFISITYIRAGPVRTP